MSDPFDSRAAEELRDTVRALLCTLLPRERRVIELRFGIEDGNDRTLEETARLTPTERGGPMTRERARQIEARALRKLCHPSRSDWLKPFVEG